MKIPENLLYTNEHEWINIKGDIATVGITDFAQSELGDIVFVEFPEIGDKFTKGETFGTIEAVKTVADLYSPVSGEIIQINETLEETPEFINKDPYSEGWIVKIKVFNMKECDELLNHDSYKGIIS